MTTKENLIHAYKSGSLVRRDSLVKGDLFIDISGNLCRADDQDAKYSGAYNCVVISRDGENSCHAGCADVLVVGGDYYE
jgi:hypothetical protein